MTRFDTLTLRAVGETLAVDWSPVERLPPPAVRVLDHRPAAPRLTVRLRAEPEPTDGELREAFVEFLKRDINTPKSEFFIPLTVSELVESGTSSVKLLTTDSKWFGVTYSEDRPAVVEKLAELHRTGVYPEKLF